MRKHCQLSITRLNNWNGKNKSINDGKASHLSFYHFLAELLKDPADVEYILGEIIVYKIILLLK